MANCTIKMFKINRGVRGASPEIINNFEVWFKIIEFPLNFH